MQPTPQAPQYMFLVTHTEASALRSSRPYLRLRLLLLLHGIAAWWCERCGRVWQVADRLDQPCFLVVELVVVRSICEEIGQELEQPLLVHDEELLHLVGLVGVGSENLASIYQQSHYRGDNFLPYLEHMEALVLHHPSVVLELPHDQLQIVPRVDIARHDLVELTVQQDLSQQLDALSLGDITLRPYQDVVVALEEQIKVRANVLRDQGLMLGEQQAEGVEGVGADFEGGLVDPAEEFPEDALAGARLAGVDVGVDVDCLAVRERLVVQYDSGDGVPFESFLQDAAAGTGALAAVVAVAESNNEFGLLPDDIAQGVRFRGRAVRAPKPKDVRDDSLSVLARFKR